MLFEQGFNLKNGIRSFREDSNITNVSTGIIGGFTIGLVAVPLIIQAGQSANLPANVVESWVFSTYFFGALMGIILALGYKLPIAGAWSIPGVFAITQVIADYTMEQAVGAFLIAGIIVLIIGLSGWIKKIVSYIPAPIMSAMVAGVLFKWATNIIGAFQSELIICLAGVIGYWVSSKVLKRIPPVLGTLIFGLLASFTIRGVDFNQLTFGIAKPMFFTPAFSMQSVLSISIPLALLIIGAENMQAYGVLNSKGYKAPINTMTIMSGIGGLIAPWTGGHNANIAGPMTAFCADETAGPKEKRYVAAVWNGILFAVIGIFAPVSLSLLTILPGELINLLVGLVLMGIIINALSSSFGSKKFLKGAFFSFVIALSGLTMLKIGSAFWALLIGTIISMVFEKEDFQQEEEKVEEVVEG